MTNVEYRAAARIQYGTEGMIEIDENAPVSRGADDGAYVQAWLWVDSDSPSEDQETGEDEE